MVFLDYLKIGYAFGLFIYLFEKYMMGPSFVPLLVLLY